MEKILGIWGFRHHQPYLIGFSLAMIVKLYQLVNTASNSWVS